MRRGRVAGTAHVLTGASAAVVGAYSGLGGPSPVLVRTPAFPTTAGYDLARSAHAFLASGETDFPSGTSATTP